jgi:peptidyl-prolyl cis-trans isomerase C
MRFRPAILAASLLTPVLAPVPALAQAAPQAGPATVAPAPGASPGAPAPAAENPLIAKVNGEEVRLSDVAATAAEVLPPEMRSMPPAMLLQMLPPEISRQIVERTITERALVAAARAAGLDRDEEVRQRIRRAEEQELTQALLSREVGATVTEAAIRARYDQEAARRTGEEEVHARHILVQTETEARAALAEVGRGEDFAAVARRRSSGPGAQEGGDLGFFKRSDMVPEFATAAFALQAGQVSQAPVRTPFGWHIIKVEERRTAPVPPFEEARQQVQRKMLEEGVDGVVRRIRAGAQVERFDQPPAPTPGGALLDNAAPPAPASPPASAPGGRSPAAPQPQRR